ncbi:hypothetical protein PMAYCL1PPCAC_00960, partial [Pristionchus mayeri]
LSILIVDVVWGFLVCPISMAPLTSMLCTGIVCETTAGRQISIVLQAQCVVQVAMTVTATLHSKYITVVVMTNKQCCFKRLKLAVRLLYCSVIELPIIALLFTVEEVAEIREFLI